jgi:hypothetical protein
MLCLLCYCIVFQVMLDVTIALLMVLEKKNALLMQLYLRIQLKHFHRVP